MIAEKRKQSALPSGCPSGRQIFNHQNLLDNALSPQETAPLSRSPSFLSAGSYSTGHQDSVADVLSCASIEICLSTILSNAHTDAANFTLEAEKPTHVSQIVTYHGELLTRMPVLHKELVL